MAIRYINVVDAIGDTGSSDSRLIFGDFDNDGDIDILYQSGTAIGQGIGYRRNDGGGSFTDFANASSPGTPFTNVDFTGVNVLNSPLFVVDFDNDGDVDIINRFSNATSILRNDAGSFRLVADAIGDTGTSDTRVVFGDFDNDGDVDVLYQASTTAGQGIGYRRNDGNGTFTDFANANVAGTPFANTDFSGINVVNSPLFVVDYDNDGDVDIINRFSNATSILRNDGGSFRVIADAIGDTGASDGRVVFADFDSDGDVDVLYQASTVAGQNIGYKRNNGNGTFTDFADARAAGSPFAGADFTGFQIVNNSTTFAVDYDNDGDVDLVSRISGATRIIAQASSSGDGSPPTLVSSTPADNGMGIAQDVNITLTFDESVVRGSGNVRIVRVSDGVVVETIAIGSGQVTGSGTTWTINPNATLTGGVSYAINIDRGAFVDADGAIYAGLDGLTRLNFTVQAAVPPAITTSGGAASFVEGADVSSAPVIVDGGLVLSDADSATLASATVAITSGFQSSQDVLRFTANSSLFGNIAGTYEAATGVLTLTSSGATATVAQFQAALRSVSYLNTSETPTTGSRTVSFTARDSTAAGTPATKAVTVAASNDAPINTVPGAQSGTEDLAIIFSATNGNAIAVGDVDAAALTVSLQVGAGTLTLSTVVGLTFSSGANGAAAMTFSGTTSAINAALNGLTFRGALNFAGGETLTIRTTDNGQSGAGGVRSDEDTVSITLAADGVINGNAANNVLQGTPQDDFFDLRQGGDDQVVGAAGNDGFYFGAAYTGTDVVDGGEGTRDQIGLQGNYATGTVLGAMTNVEIVVLLSGGDARFGDTAGSFYDYGFTTIDATVTAGRNLIVQANTLRVGEDFTFNGSAELDGTFTIYGGLGADVLTGGNGDDGFFFGQGRFGASDVVNGGAGTMDQLGLQGDYTGANAIVFGTTQLTGVEAVVLLSASDNRFAANGGIARYDLTMNDGNVASGVRLLVSANTLRTAEALSFRGDAERDGSFQIFSGGGDDVLRGGRGVDDLWGAGGADRIVGNGGADTMRGGTGNDVFAYLLATDSTSTARDQILDFATGDQIDLSGLVGSTGGGNFTFVGAAAQTGARQVQVTQSGSAATVSVFVDADATADLVIELSVIDGHAISVADFSGLAAQSQGAGLRSVGEPAPSSAFDSDTSSIRLWLGEADVPSSGSLAF